MSVYITTHTSPGFIRAVMHLTQCVVYMHTHMHTRTRTLYVCTYSCVRRVCTYTYNSIFDVPMEEGVPLSKFLFVVGQLKFRGTSVLFRLPRPPVVKATKSQIRVRELSPSPRSIPPEPNRDAAVDKSTKSEKKVCFVGVGAPEEKMEVGAGREEVDGGDEVSVEPNETLPMGIRPLGGRREGETEEEDVLGAFSGLGGDGFSIATHFVKVNSFPTHRHTQHGRTCVHHSQVRRSGAVADVTTLWDLVGTDMVSGSLDDVLTARPGFDRLPSLNAFDKVSLVYVVLHTICSLLLHMYTLYLLYLCV